MNLPESYLKTMKDMLGDDYTVFVSITLKYRQKIFLK